MNFAKLFGKKDAKKQPQGGDKAQQTADMLQKKIDEQEMKIKNIETKTNAMQNEAKAKLKAGDKAGAKRILAKKEICRTNKTIRRCNGNDGRTKIYVRKCITYKRCCQCN